MSRPPDASVRPRVVIGAPLYNKADYLPLAVDSILAQTYRDFVLLLIDDQSSDATPEVCAAYVSQDHRVVFERNPVRLGMLGNTRRAFLRARELHPEAPYWALGSDHDIWEPEWLEKMVAELDADPSVVLAYPLASTIDEAGRSIRPARIPVDTAGVTDRRERVRRAFDGMVAGDMIYGVFRAASFARVGPYRTVLVPDRLLLSELAWHGTFKRVPEALWSRRFRGLADLDRQRAAFFPDGVPLAARLPWWQAHVAVLVWEYGVCGRGRPDLGRREGLALAWLYLGASVRLRIRRRWARARKRVKRTVRALRPRKLVLRVLERAYYRLAESVEGERLERILARPRLRALALDRVAPALDLAADVLERAGSAPEAGSAPGAQDEETRQR